MTKEQATQLRRHVGAIDHILSLDDRVAPEPIWESINRLIVYAAEQLAEHREKDEG